jgi:hypothetical protein
MEAKDIVSAYLLDLIIRMRYVAVSSDVSIMVLDKRVSFVCGKIATFMVDIQRKYLGSTMYRSKETSIKGGYFITLSGITMRMFQLSASNIVFLDSDEDEKTVVIIVTDKASDYRSNHVNSVVRCSFYIQLGDADIVHPCPDTRYVKCATVCPIGSTIEGSTGSTPKDLLLSFSQEIYRLLRQGDEFACRAIVKNAELKVIETDPPNYSHHASYHHLLRYHIAYAG